MATRTHFGLLSNGQNFRIEVAIKDAQGFHKGYGPGSKVWTKGGERDHRWFAPQPVYVESK